MYLSYKFVRVESIMKYISTEYNIIMVRKLWILNVIKNKEMFHGKQGVIYITCKERDD